MAGICLPIDAVSGAPSFPASQHRVALGALAGAAAGRPLGARSGIRPGAEPAVTVTATQWTVTPFSFVADPGTSGAVGAYLGAFTANETGAIDAADAAQTRIDRLDVCVPDDPAGSDPRAPWVKYKPGTPGAGVAPAAPARSFPLGTVTVPKVGGGAPSFTPTWPYLAAPGAPVPVRSQAERDALALWSGLQVERLDTGARETYRGGKWVGPYFEEFTFKGAAIASSSYALINSSALTPSKLIGTSAFDLATGLWTCPADGIYAISASWLGSVSAGTAIRCATAIIDKTVNMSMAADGKTIAGYPAASVSVEAWIPAGEQIGVYVFVGSAGQAFSAGSRYSFRRVSLG